MLYLNKGYKSLYCICHKICYCVQNAFSSQFSLPLFGISKPACPPWPLSHWAAQTHKLSHASHIWLVYNSDLIAGKPFMASPFQRMSLMLAFCCALGLLTMCMGGGDWELPHYGKSWMFSHWLYPWYSLCVPWVWETDSSTTHWIVGGSAIG